MLQNMMSITSIFIIWRLTKHRRQFILIQYRIDPKCFRLFMRFLVGLNLHCVLKNVRKNVPYLRTALPHIHADLFVFGTYHLQEATSRF